MWFGPHIAIPASATAHDLHFIKTRKFPTFHLTPTFSLRQNKLTTSDSTSTSKHAKT